MKQCKDLYRKKRKDKDRKKHGSKCTCEGFVESSTEEAQLAYIAEQFKGFKKALETLKRNLESEDWSFSKPKEKTGGT